MANENLAQNKLRQFLTSELGEARTARNQAELDLKRTEEEVARARDNLRSQTERVSYLETRLADEQPKGTKAHHAPAHETHKAKSA